jgi:pyridoxal 5'-phosphate synthase pdxS subunit
MGDISLSNGNAPATGELNGSSLGPDFTVKAGLAQMLKGGVIMDVVNAEQVSTHPPS